MGNLLRAQLRRTFRGRLFWVELAAATLLALTILLNGYFGTNLTNAYVFKLVARMFGYAPLMGVFVPLLLAADHGRLRILIVIACVVASDTGAFAVGVLFGRHKMAPSISPGKTWEGFAGGVAVAAAVGAVGVHLLLDTPWWVGLILGALCSLGGTVGDLVESLIKRDAGLKDMSNFLPGHGGIMDRLDSMLVAVPVGWLVLHLALG